MPGIEEVLGSLSDKRLAAVSNGTMKSTEFTLRELGIIDYFDDVLAPSTHEIQDFYDLRKPSPNMLERVMRVMKVQNCLMVGDSTSDILAANRAGIDSAFLDIYGKELKREPDYRIQELKELGDIVSG
jgi:phosphoglycolate phosphatase